MFFQSFVRFVYKNRFVHDQVKYMAVKQIGRYCRMAGEAATREMLQNLVNEVNASNPGESTNISIKG